MKKLIYSLRSRIQTITSSLVAGRLPRAIYGRSLASTLFFFSAALLVQPCAAAPGQWEYTGMLNTGRFSHTATLLADGKVLVTGGFGTSSGDQLASAELYDPATGTWTFTGTLNTARAIHTATLLPDGRVLVAGGFNDNIHLASAELYDPASGTWTVTHRLNQGRYLHTATLLPTGEVLVAAGVSDVHSLASAELYDP